MTWDQVNALLALGLLIVAFLAALPVWITIWPMPQIKRKSQSEDSAVKSTPFARRLKWISVSLVASLGFSAAAIIGAWWQPAIRVTHFPPMKLEQVNDKYFKNEVVKLDGKQFNHVTFENVTYLYDGTASYSFNDCHNRGAEIRIQTNSDAVEGGLSLQKILQQQFGGAMRIIQVDDKGNPLP